VIRVALKGILGRKLRAVLTGFAIVLGVAMVSGSLVLTDTIQKSFDRIFDESYENSDIVISSKEAISSDGESGAGAPGFPADVLRAVEQLPGVEAAAGSIEDEAKLADEQGQLISGTGIALSVDPSADQRFNPLGLVEGRWPQGDEEIAIDRAAAEKKDLQVGDTIGVVADGPLRTHQISGLVRFGSVDSLGGTTIAVFDIPTAQRLFDKVDKLDIVRVAAAEGVSGPELVQDIRPLLPETA
jgi:putative ABC transport system permease protein